MLAIATKARFVSRRAWPSRAPVRSVSRAALYLSLLPLRPSDDDRVRLIQPPFDLFGSLFISPLQWLLWGETPALKRLAHHPERHSPAQTLPKQRLNRPASPQRLASGRRAEPGSAPAEDSACSARRAYALAFGIGYPEPLQLDTPATHAIPYCGALPIAPLAQHNSCPAFTIE